MNCQGWSRRGGFRLFARQGRTGDTAAGTLDSWLAGHVLLQGTIIPPAHTEGKTSTIKTEC